MHTLAVHTHLPVHTLAWVHSHACIYVHSCKDIKTHAYMYLHNNTHTANAQNHIRTSSIVFTYTHTHTLKQTYIHTLKAQIRPLTTQACTLTCNHPPIRTIPVCKHSCTHTHMHICACIQNCMCTHMGI